MKTIILAVLLFFVLTPGILLRLPKKGSKFVVAGVHAIVFGVLLWLLGKFVMNSFEGFEEGAAVGLGNVVSPGQKRFNEITGNATKIQSSLTEELNKITGKEYVDLKNAYTKEYGDSLNDLKTDKKIKPTSTVEEVNKIASTHIPVKEYNKPFVNLEDGSLLSGDIVKFITDTIKSTAVTKKPAAANLPKPAAKADALPTVGVNLAVNKPAAKADALPTVGVNLAAVKKPEPKK